MSAYSEFLRKYISEKDVKVSKLIQYCELDRSTMYKIINGKRKPASLQLVKKIANYIQLTPKECELYYEAYYKTVQGEELFFQNKQIQELICDFNRFMSRPVYMKKTDLKIEIVDNEAIHMLHGKNEIDYYIQMLLEKEALRSSPKVRLISQFDNQNLLQMLITLGKNMPNMRLQHILCFQKQEEYSRQNLEILQKVLEFYACGCQYEPYYYYDQIFSHFYNMNLFCNCIICESGILSYTSDGMYGQLIRKEECIKTYIQLFERYLGLTYPLLTRVESVIQEYISVGQTVLDGMTQSMAYSFHAEPCVVPFITENILKKSIRYEMPKRDEVIKTFGKYILDERKAVDKGKFKSYFTADGVEKFILNGKIGEVPSDFYYSFKKEDCLEILKEMIPYFKDGKYRLMKNRLSEIQSDLHIFVAPHTGHFLFPNTKNELVYLYINEPGMLRQFYEFMENLNEELFLYTTQESVDIIKKMIKKYQ